MCVSFVQRSALISSKPQCRTDFLFSYHAEQNAGAATQGVFMWIVWYAATIGSLSAINTLSLLPAQGLQQGRERDGGDQDFAERLDEAVAGTHLHPRSNSGAMAMLI